MHFIGVIYLDFRNSVINVAYYKSDVKLSMTPGHPWLFYLLVFSISFGIRYNLQALLKKGSANKFLTLKLQTRTFLPLECKHASFPSQTAMPAKTHEKEYSQKIQNSQCINGWSFLRNVQKKKVLKMYYKSENQEFFRHFKVDRQVILFKSKTKQMMILS